MTEIVRSRVTIRRNPPGNRTPRYVEPWALPEAKDGTPLAKLERAFFSALEAVDAIETHKAEAVASKKFTDEGVIADALEFAASKLAPQLKRAKHVVDKAREELAAKRAKLTLKAADKTDAAGQMRRLYKLDKFNALPDSERGALISGGIESGNLDPDLRQAIFEMGDCAKVFASDVDRLRDQTLRAQYGDDAVDEIAELETAVATADMAITASREEIAQDVGGVQKLDDAAKPFEEHLGALWLKKQDDAVKVFKQTGADRGAWIDALPNEVEAGRFFEDYNDWQAAGGVWPLAQQKGNGHAS
jgi:hypothetical protein